MYGVLAVVTAFVIVVIVGVSVCTAWLCWLGVHAIYERPPIEQVLKRHLPSLLALPGVHDVAIGQAKGVPCIVVFARELTERESSRIPADLEGWSVRRQTVHHGYGAVRGRNALPASRSDRVY